MLPGVDYLFEPYERQGLTIERALAHARRLAGEAAESLARDPSSRPVAMIFTPDCAAIRDSLPKLIRSGASRAACTEC